MAIIDSQVHAYEANTPKRPWHTVPNWPAHVTGDEMVAAMDKVGVDGAIFISAFSMYRYDASYAVEVQRAHPGRFGLVKPVDPDDPAVAEVIAEWKTTPGAVGVRIMMPQEAGRDPDHPGLGHRLIMPHPDTGCGKFDEAEVVEVVFLEPRGDCAEMLEFAKEALDQIAVAIEPRTEGWHVRPVRHGLDIGPGAPFGHLRAQGVAVVTSVGKQDLPRLDRVEQVGRGATVVRLALAQLERDRVAVGVHHGMDFGRQSAARAPHASGCIEVPSGGCRRAPFLTLAACW